MSRPSSTCAGPVLRIPRSGATTFVVTVEWSSLGVEVGGPVAVFVTVPVTVGWTTTVAAVLVAPTASVPRAQVMMFDALVQLPLIDSNVVLGGIGSENLAFTYGTRPVFFTVMV